MEPPRRHTREDSGIRLDRELGWWHDGEPIEHPRIIEAFNRGVRVRDDGRVTLELGDDWCFIEVEDCAFAVTAVDVSEGSRLSVRLSDRTAEWLDQDTLALDGDALTVMVKGRRARARFSRDAQAQLGDFLEAREGRLVLRVGERVWPTPLPAPPDAPGLSG